MYIKSLIISDQPIMCKIVRRSARKRLQERVMRSEKIRGICKVEGINTWVKHRKKHGTSTLAESPNKRYQRINHRQEDEVLNVVGKVQRQSKNSLKSLLRNKQAELPIKGIRKNS